MELSVTSSIYCLLWIFIFSFGEISGESILANVTKTTLHKSIVLSNESTSTKPTTRSEQMPQKDFAPPKVISLNAGEKNEKTGYTVFPLQSGFHLTENDGLEETFTYQVKKQRKPPNDPLSIQDEFQLLQQRAKRESFEAVQYFMKELEKEMNEKVHNLSVSVNNLSNAMMGNVSAVTSAWDQLNQDVLNLTKSTKETSRLVKVMQFNHEQEAIENKVLMEQVANLTKEVAIMREERAEDNDKILSAIAGLQSKLDNTTYEVRIHEAHLRYGQQVMASMKELVEKNIDRITGLETDGKPQWTQQTVGCGGVVIANSGIISNKFRQPYLNDERCVWIIRANRRSKINLQLLEDGFQNQTNTDFLTVTEFAEDQHPVTLITSSRLEHGNNALHTFQGPIIFVTFYSDATLPGTGFTLKFNGAGNRTDAASVNAVRHLNIHLSEPVGVFTYPEDNALTYQPNELVTLAINPAHANLLKIFMKHSDLEKDENCEFDSISLYGSMTGSYALTKRYCHQGEDFPTEIIQSSDGIFLVIFRTDASTQFSGFQLTWEIE